MQSLTALLLMIGVHQASLEPAINRLGSDAFWEREEAHKLLATQTKVPWAEFLIRSFRKPRGDPEIEARLGMLSKDYNSFLTGYGMYPWIDALPKDYPDRDKIISKYLSLIETGENFVNYRVATYLWLSDLQKKGWWNSDLMRIQLKMIEREKFFQEQGRYP